METIAHLFGVLWAPRKTLYEVARQPRVIAPLVLLCLFAGAEAAILFSALDPGKLKVEQLDRDGVGDQISDSDKVLHAEGARQGRGFAIVSSVLGPLVIVFFVAGVFYLCLGLGRNVGFLPFLSVTAYAFIPGVFHSIAKVMVTMTAERTPLTLLMAGSISPIRFLSISAVSQPTYLALSMVDIVSIWILALLVIGYGFILRDRVGLVPRIAVVGGAYCVISAAFVVLLISSGIAR